MQTLLKNTLSVVRDPHKVIALICAGVLLAFASGAFAQAGNVYSDRSAQVAGDVLRAVVLQARPVQVEPQNVTRYAGGAAGAALGGGLGALLGRKSDRAATVLGIVGATLGGLAGNSLTERIGATSAMEYIVETEPNQHGQVRRMAVTQPEPALQLAAGEVVYLIQTSGSWRVVKALTPPLAPSAGQTPFGDETRVNAPRTPVKEVSHQFGRDYL